MKVATSLLVVFTSLLGLSLQGQISGRSDDRALPGTLPAAEIRSFLADPSVHETYVPQAPLGILTDLASVIPSDNPLTAAKVELGRQLYFDKRLSRDNTVSCATCHDPALGWTDVAPVSTGIDGQQGGRSAPTVINRVLHATQFWDGRAASLEEQALGPIGNPIEMGFSPEEAVERIARIEGYRLQFEAVFGGEPTPDGVAKAIASFERTILSGANKNDYFDAAYPFFDWEPDEDEDPELLARANRALDLESEFRMSPAAERGRDLFFDKAKCATCHVGENLTDESFHNIGVSMKPESMDEGRYAITGDKADRGAFRTPTLREIVHTAPYMHDGSMLTLREVVEHYDQGGNKNPWLSDKIFPLELTEGEKQDLVRFMEEALSGQVTPVEVPRLP